MHPSGSQQDSLLGIEKGLVQGLSESRNGELLSQLTQTVARDSDRPVNERSESSKKYNEKMHKSNCIYWLSNADTQELG